MTTLEDVTKKRAEPPSAEAAAATELVRLAKEQGLSLTGPDGLLKQFTKTVLETALNEEMTEHLGHDKNQAPPERESTNIRNGTRPKTVLTEAAGHVPIEVPRDREGTFEPQIVKKRQRRLNGVDEIVLSLYAKGLTTGEISAHFAEIYGASVSKETISRITDKVLEEMQDWAARPLDEVYAAIFVDAIVVKVRDGQVANRPIYAAIGVSLDGHRDVLGLWAGTGGEGAKFWMSVLTDRSGERRDQRSTKADPDWPMCGIPDILYADHGSDFTSEHLTQVAADLTFQIVYSAVARPQGRGKIERFFGTVTTELLPELPGHLHRGRRLTAPALTLTDLDHALRHFIVDTYHRRQHPEIGTSPHDRWLADGWLPRMPTDLSELDLLLVDVAKPRIVHRDGIHFQGLRYLDPLLAAYVREPVTIRYDPRDITEIRVFHHGRFLCKAINPDHIGDTVTLKDIDAARRAHRRRLRSQVNERIAVAVAATQQPVSTAPPEPRPPRSRLRTYQQD